jgi:hypothetical protein
MGDNKRLLNDIVNIIYRYIHRSLMQKANEEYKGFYYFSSWYNFIICNHNIHGLFYRELDKHYMYEWILNYRTHRIVAPLPKRYFH